MKHRSLGSTGLVVSEVGFGAWGIGGVTKRATSYGPTDDNESKATLREAFNKGITFYDTSDLYGYGHSEELIGEVFDGMRDRVVIATKFGFLEHRGPQDFSSDYIKKALDGSLRRLRTSYVDLYQLHSPPIAEVVDNSEEIIETLESLRSEGRIRAYGISVRNPDDGIVAIEKLGFKSVQVNLSMIDQRAVENGLLELARKRKAGIIARTPFCFGFLTGKITSIDFGPSDHRSAWPREQLERWVQASALFAGLNADKRRTLAQLALKFCVSFDSVASAIPGMMFRTEVEENATADDLDALTEEELEAIEKVYRENVFFVGSRGD